MKLAKITIEILVPVESPEDGSRLTHFTTAITQALLASMTTEDRKVKVTANLRFDEVVPVVPVVGPKGDAS